MTATHSHHGRKRRVLQLACLLALTVPACSSGGSTSPPTSTSGQAKPITSAVVSSRTTQHIRVWAPSGHGRWPVVYALPGISGNKADLDQLGPALARHGVVVFASDYRPSGTFGELARDVVCGYRYVRSIAHAYGGDLTLPVTGVGYSAGARFISAVRAPMFGPGGTFKACLPAAPVADVLVGVNGCYYAYKGLTFTFSTAPLGSTDVKLALITGLSDDVCASWQSEKAARALRAAGFDPTLVSIPGANHYTPVFHDLDHGKWITLAHDAAGERTTQAILRAIHSAHS